MKIEVTVMVWEKDNEEAGIIAHYPVTVEIKDYPEGEDEALHEAVEIAANQFVQDRFEFTTMYIPTV